jgi:hypothetical protein
MWTQPRANMGLAWQNLLLAEFFIELAFPNFVHFIVKMS